MDGSTGSFRRPGATTGQYRLGPSGHCGAVDLGVVADVDGQLAKRQHGRDRPGDQPPHLVGRGGARQTRFRAAGSSSTTTSCWTPTGPTPTAAERATPDPRSTARSTGTGVIGPDSLWMTWTVRPSTHSRPASSKWPTSPERCQTTSPSNRRRLLLGVPQVEVAVGDPRRGHEDLAVVRRSLTPRSLSTGCPTQTPPTGIVEHGRVDGREVDVGDRAAPRSCRRACAATRDGASPATAWSVSGGTGAPAENTVRSPARPAHVARVGGRRHDVGQRRRGPEGECGTDADAGVVEHRGRQLGRLGDVARRQACRDAERRAVQRERRERRDETVVGGDAVGPGERVALRRELPVAVHHPLRRPGGAGGEQDRRHIVRRRFGRQR